MADYQVPQFIEDESRLIGPFTLTQIGILVIGCGSAFIFYKLFKSFIGIPLAVIILFLTGMLTFSQMNNMPLYKMIVPILKHFILPKSYQWSQPRFVKNLSQINTQKVLDSDTPNKSTHNFKKIDDLTKILDKGNE
mgnify:CR=1 FL=1